MASPSIFSSLVNNDYSKGSIDAQEIERNMMGDTSAPEDDKEKIMARFKDTLRGLEQQTGVKMITPVESGHSRAAPTQSRPTTNQSIFDFDPDESAPPQPPPQPTYTYGARFRKHEEESDSDSDSDSASYSSSESDGKPRRLSTGVNRLRMSESPRGLGPLEMLSVEEMIRDIDLFRHYLIESGESLQGVKEVDDRSSYADVQRVHSFLSILYASKNYVNIFGDGVVTVSSFLEYYFDGSLRVFGKFPINYKGLGRTMSHKFQSNRKVVGGAAHRIATRVGISPEWIVAADFLMPFISIPMKNASSFSGGINNPDSAGVLNGH